MFFDKLSDVMVVFVKSMESYVILDKRYLTVLLPKIRLRPFISVISFLLPFALHSDPACLIFGQKSTTILIFDISGQQSAHTLTIAKFHKESFKTLFNTL